MQLKLKRFGHVLGITVAAVALLSGGVVVTMLQDGTPPSPPNGSPPDAPGNPGGAGNSPQIPQAMRPMALMMMCGLTPEALAVAGCMGEDAQAMLIASGSMADEGAGVLQRVAQADAADRAHRSLESELRRYGGTPQQRAQLGNLRSAAQSANALKRASLTEYRAGMLDHLAARVGAGNAALAASYIANSDRSIPRHWRVLALGDLQMEALESFVAHDGAADYEPSPAESAAIAIVNVSADVSIAAQRLETLAPLVSQVLSQLAPVDETDAGAP
ncbi:MAG: hypothetical protein H6812_04530 [Phycisphaeraceae bacterium]|nr:hypothetical protein [Phycisphaeraceae bacterium]